MTPKLSEIVDGLVAHVVALTNWANDYQDGWMTRPAQAQIGERALAGKQRAGMTEEELRVAALNAATTVWIAGVHAEDDGNIPATAERFLAWLKEA